MNELLEPIGYKYHIYHDKTDRSKITHKDYMIQLDSNPEDMEDLSSLIWMIDRAPHE